MKSNRTCILLYGHDERLLATRQWVLESRGYRVLTSTNLAAISLISQTLPVSLLLLCHTLSQEEAATALTRATARWPRIQSLALRADTSRAPSGILGQMLHTMDGPARLLSQVGEVLAEDGGAADPAHT